MIFRILLFAAVIGAAFYTVKLLLTPSGFVRCKKCEGKGYWLSTRGLRDTCDECGGVGKLKKA